MSIFARLGSIKGESRDARHQDEIDVLSWSWGVSSSGATGHGGGVGGGAGVGRASFHAFTFTHHIDKASPLLMKACATGEHLRDGTVTVRTAGTHPQEHLVISMTDLIVTRVSLTVSAEGDSSLEEVVLAFAKVDLEYRAQKPDGTLEPGIHFTHDLSTH